MKRKPEKQPVSQKIIKKIVCRRCLNVLCNCNAIAPRN